MRVPALRRGRAGDPDPDDDPPAALTDAVRATERVVTSVQNLVNLTTEHERRTLAADRQAITRQAKRRQAQSLALLHAAADRVRLDVGDLLRHASPYSYQSWESPIWAEAYIRPTNTPALAQVATLSLRSPFSTVELPFALPVLGASLLVTHEEGGRTAAHHLAQAFVTRALASALPGALHVRLLDPGGLGENLGVLSRLPPPLAPGGVHVTPREITAALDLVRAQVQYLNSNVLVGGNDSLVKRWERGTANGIPCAVVLAAGLGAGLSAEHFRQLWTIAQDSNRHGVSLVAVLDDSRQLPPGVTVADLSGHTEHIHVDDAGRATWESAPRGLRTHTRLECPDPPGERQHRFLAEVLAPAAQRATKPGGPT